MGTAHVDPPGLAARRIAADILDGVLRRKPPLDEQLAHRDHFVRLTHPFMGEGAYERNGFRLSDASSGYTRTSPTLGQDNAGVLGDILGLSAEEQARLAREGVLE